MTTPTEAAAAMREALIASLFEDTRDLGLNVARVTSVVDRALERTGYQALLESLVAAADAVVALNAEVPTPPPAVAAAVASWTTAAGTVNASHGSELVQVP